MNNLKNSHFLVDLGITEDDSSKNLEGVFFASSAESAATSALLGECHNIDDESKDDFNQKIADCVNGEGNVEDDVFTYHIRSIEQLSVVNTVLDGKKIQLAVATPSGKSEINTSGDSCFLLDIMWGLWGYEKNLAPVVFAANKEEAILEALVLESANLPTDEDGELDKNNEDYESIRAEIIAEIKKSDNNSMTDSGGLYIGKSATELKAIDFNLNGFECTGFIDPTNDNFMRVYLPCYKN